MIRYLVYSCRARCVYKYDYMREERACWSVSKFRQQTRYAYKRRLYVRRSPSTATIHGDGGLGIILGPKAMRIAIDKAKTAGVGTVTMYNGRHLGAVGHHAMLAAKEDMVGMCMTATQPSIVPTFGAEARFGTNPVAIAAPAKNQPPVLFDVATSAVAGNKIGLAARVGSNLLPGWIADREGKPLMEETRVQALLCGL
jgi:L-2-hydroxycarboxylate dehydrogenase (NAD+)